MESREQNLAINHVDGPALVLAGPGSGKTFVLTRRIKHLIFDENINADNILVITFTRQAANEMKSRFKKLCIEDNKNLKTEPTFGTFHSVFFEILRNDFGFSNDSLMTYKEEKKYVKTALEKIYKTEINDSFVSEVLKDIKEYKLSKEKGEGYSPKSISKRDFKKFYNSYKNILFEYRKLDFHDMIELCSELLSENRDILKKYREKYKYILIDEFQDINKEQYDIIKLLSKNKNLFVVGDDDQSIYKFRGSKPSVMNDFLNDYKNAEVIHLDRNYRCARGIVQFSKKVIDNNKNRFKKNLVSNRDSCGDVEVRVFNDSTDENQYILDIIKDKINKNIPLSDIAILYRTNLLSSSITEVLSKAKIPYIIKDMKKSPYEHFAIKDLIEYLNNKNAVNPSAAIKYIRQDMGYDNYLKNYCQSKRMIFNEVIELLNNFEELAKRFKNIKELIEYIDSYKNIINEQNEKENENRDAIKLMTFHSSKGLEFETVIIIDANDGIIPHKKSIKAKDVETERRLFYVAMTRAKNDLHIFFTTNRNGKNYKPSRFILEALKEVPLNE